MHPQWRSAGPTRAAASSRFAVTALVLGIVSERVQPASRVVETAAIAGVVAILVDLVVL
jgi:hypothetical protein